VQQLGGQSDDAVNALESDTHFHEIMLRLGSATEAP
jgi:hypothetical protein